MPTKGIVFRPWISGSVLIDGIYCHAVEAGRASRLDDVIFWSSPCHYHTRAVYAVTARGRQQRCGCVPSHRGLTQGDWELD